MTWRTLLARRLRLALSAFAIVLGVAFVSGSFVFTDAMGEAFDGIVEGTTSDVEVAYRGAGDFGAQEDLRSIPARTVARLRELPGAAAVHASVQSSSVFVVGRDGRVVGGDGPPGIAVNHTGARSVSGRPVLTLERGRYPRATSEVALESGTAADAGYAVGDRVRLVAPGSPATFSARLVGLVRLTSGGIGGASVSVLNVRLLQERFLGGRDAYTSVSLDTAPGVSQHRLAAEAQRVLPPDVVAQPGDELVQRAQRQLDQVLGFLTTFLLVFAGISLVVGAFLIVNTFSILVAQRSRELALLRALGASRRQVNVSVLVEAAAVGLVGSTAGLALGYALALLLRLLFERAGLDLGSAALPVHVRTVLASYVVGLVVTLLAAYLPARRASRVAPVAALRDDVALPESSVRRRLVVGSLVVLGGAATGLLGMRRGDDGGLLVLGAGMLAVLLGVTLLSPWLGRPVTRAMQGGYRRAFGTVGTLAAQNSLRNPRRTAATAGALMIGLTLVSLMAVLGRSATASSDAAVARVVTSQLVVSSVVNAPFSPEVATQVRRVDGVASVAEVRSAYAPVAGRGAMIAAVDPQALGAALALPTTRGSLLALAPGTVAMSDRSAQRRGLALGDTVPVAFQGATVPLRLVATFQGSAVLPASVLTTPDAFRKGRLRPLDTLLYVSLDPGADAKAVHRAVDRAVAALPTVTVKDPAQLAQEQRKNVDLFLRFIYALLGLAVVIAVLGIVNTLALSVVERTREVGLLRAVGMSRRQLRLMVRLEAVVVAVLGGSLGVVLGLVFGVALQRAVADQGVDVLAVPWAQLAGFVALSVVAGVLAAVLPARRAARLDVLRAIGTE